LRWQSRRGHSTSGLQRDSSADADSLRRPTPPSVNATPSVLRPNASASRGRSRRRL
jgi:hypothetical protein